MQRRQGAGIEERVGQGDLPEGGRHPVAQQHPGNGLAEPTDNGAVFCSHDKATGLSGFGKNGLLIQWFDRRHMQHSDIDAVRLQLLGRFQCAHRHQAGG